ncbi:hypothetical protein [Jeotgalibacillus aurantiacus]|uniref:hypothetical protein n=1 Tax=Jeotgalibacillus aurantiacus TaxID=2763266 RepID=UPI001D0ABFEC|nr:hypothetical protein [Jeotgalibacillus aurantiacus]
MNWLFLLLIPLIILFIKIKLSIDIQSGRDRIFCVLKLYAAGIRIKKWIIPFKYGQKLSVKMKVNGEKKRMTVHDFKLLVHQYKQLKAETTGLRTWGRQTLRKISIEKYDLRVKAGTGSADTTALVIGMMYPVLAFLQTGMSLWVPFRCKPDVNVYPSFNEPSFSVGFSCIGSIKAGQLIKAGLLFLLRNKAIDRKAGEKNGTSN